MPVQHEDDAAAEPVVFRIAITEPTAIDPYRAQEGEGILVTKALFSGLLELDADGKLAPATAWSWEHDATGTRWVFRLRTDVRFSDGEAVTAESFLRAWNRALDPAADTETAYHLAGIEGYGRIRSGETEQLAGATAPDEHTIEVRLSAPDFEFDLKTLQPVFSPVPASAGPALNRTYNDLPIGNGPFLLTEPWQHGRSITLRRNPDWYGARPALDEIRIDILDPVSGIDDEYAGFLAGRYDFARIPPSRLAEAAQGGENGGCAFLERELAGLHYFIPFCHQAPMDSVDARRAVSAAIDRARIVEEVFDGMRTPAHGLLSPWFGAAHQAGPITRWTEHDPAGARAAAERAGLHPGTEVELSYNTGAGHDAWVIAVAGQLTEVLGLEVRLRPMAARALVEHRTGEAAHGLCRAAWACDYPTPDNILFPLLHSSCTAPDADGTAHGDNEGRYVDPEFDTAVSSARGSDSPADRVHWWREAERIAMRDLALIPLWYRTEQRVYAGDRFTGVDLDFYGNPTLASVAPRHG